MRDVPKIGWNVDHKTTEVISPGDLGFFCALGMGLEIFMHTVAKVTTKGIMFAFLTLQLIIPQARAADVATHDQLMVQQLRSNFSRGRHAMQLCTYAIADIDKYYDCRQQKMWGKLRYLPTTTIDGGEYQEFLDYYATNNALGIATVFSIDTRIMDTFKGSVRNYCLFYELDCGLLVQWYKENQKLYTKNVKAKFD